MKYPPGPSRDHIVLFAYGSSLKIESVSESDGVAYLENGEPVLLSDLAPSPDGTPDRWVFTGHTFPYPPEGKAKVK